MANELDDRDDQDVTDDGGIPGVLGQASHLSKKADYFSGTGYEHVERLVKDHDGLRREQGALSGKLEDTERAIAILEGSKSSGGLNNEESARYEELTKTAEDIRKLMEEMQEKMDRIYSNPSVGIEMAHEAEVLDTRREYAERERKLETKELPDAFLAIFDTTLAHYMPILAAIKNLRETREALLVAFKAVENKRADLMEPSSDKLKKHNDRVFNTLKKLIEEDRLTSENISDFISDLSDGVDKVGRFSGKKSYKARIDGFIQSQQVSALRAALEAYRKAKEENKGPLSQGRSVELIDKLDRVVLSEIKEKMEEESKDRQEMGHRPQREEFERSVMFSRAVSIASEKFSGREPVDESVLLVVREALFGYANTLQNRSDGDDGKRNAEIASGLRHFAREIQISRSR